MIRVQRGPLPEKTWRVSKRYNDFVQLNAVLSLSGIDLPLPPKKIIGNMEPDFIAQRQLALQNYLNIVLMNPILASSLPMKKFLDPDNYTTPLHGRLYKKMFTCIIYRYIACNFLFFLFFSRNSITASVISSTQ